MAATTSREALTKKDVLRVAARIMRQKGYDGTSMQDIANALGIRKSSLYHRVKTKQELLFLILDESIDSVSRGLFDIAESQVDPAERLRLAIKNHISQFVEHRDSVGVLLKERNSLCPEYEKIYGPKRKRYERLFAQIIKDGITEGAFRPVDFKTTAFAILGMCNWMVQWYSPEGDKTPEQIVTLFSDLAIQMLKNSSQETCQ